MTLTEKLGQRTMTAVEHAVTGPVIASDDMVTVSADTAGHVLNLASTDHIRTLQRLAVE